MSRVVKAKDAVVARDLRKTYGAGESQVTALNNASIRVGVSKFLAILGPSGSGISTLMQCLAGLDSIDSGNIKIGGIDITSLNDRDLTRLRREHVGFIFQHFNLVSKSRLSHKPHEMSGGQQQRVAIARALVAQPTVIFADEPTGNLDSVSSSEVLRFLRDSVDVFGQTVIMVTHDPIAATYADETILLADGRITATLVSPTVEQVVAALQEVE